MMLGAVLSGYHLRKAIEAQERREKILQARAIIASKRAARKLAAFRWAMDVQGMSMEEAKQ